jgi:branched-subunit amino acid aminotransferase/4-amino-4-deoxychorismate lyase
VILIDGKPDGCVPATDSSVLRGDGVFEALRTFDGAPFALVDHLDRLASSALPMGLSLPSPETLAAWVRQAAEPDGPGIVRIIATRGDDVAPSRTIVMSQPVPDVPSPFTVLPITAPWHPAGRRWNLAGVKTLSYAPNLDASRQAQSAGFSDALLTDDDGVILEGPTFSVAWLREGVLETPGLELGILASITRRQVLDLAAEMGARVRTGRYGITRIDDATDLMAVSTVKQVTAIERCGARELPSTGFDLRLRASFLAMVEDQLGG